MKNRIILLVLIVILSSAKAHTQVLDSIFYILPDSVEVALNSHLLSLKENWLDTRVYFIMGRIEVDSIPSALSKDDYFITACIGDSKKQGFLTSNTNRFIIVNNYKIPVFLDYDIQFYLDENRKKYLGEFGNRFDGGIMGRFMNTEMCCRIIFNIKTGGNIRHSNGWGKPCFSQ